MPGYQIGALVLELSTAGFQAGNATAPAPPPGYNLASAVASVPFAVSLPTAPTITSEAVCDTEAEISASLAVNGRRTIVAPGTYSFTNLPVGGADKELVFQAGAGFVLNELQLSGARIQIDGAVLVASGQYGVRFNNPTDVRFNRLDLAASDGGYIVSGATRFAFISSVIRAYTHVAYLDEGCDGMTIANSDFEGTQPLGGINGWCIRWGAGTPQNSVLMDSRFRAQQNVVLRYEVAPTNGYFARNQIEGNNPFRTEGQMSETPGAFPLNGLWFIDNRMYSYTETGSIYVIVTSHPRMQNVTATGNRTHSPGAGLANIGFPTGQTGWTTSDNSHVVNALDNIPVWAMA